MIGERNFVFAGALSLHLIKKMSYKIIARKYRPNNFEEVIGQDIIVRTLKNSFKLNKIGQAYLFSGPRGVGKTTVARIIGKVLNCQEKKINPCEKCSFCLQIDNNNSLDYHEIDGASNRGIDQIREIQSNLNYASPLGNYRIYVIDEVHMLTIEAFNALLKSLEEPPKKIIFILCTTEIVKIPLTIRSRCQNFLFKNISNQMISQHLEKISIKEKIKFENGVFISIAKRAQGSVRDAENLLEQILLYCENKITLEAIYKVLGETSFKTKMDFFNNLYLNNLNDNKNLFHLTLNQGIQLEDFLFNLLEACTHFVFIKNKIKDLHLLDLNEGELQGIKEISRHFSQDEIFIIMDVFYEFVQEVKNNKFNKIMTAFFLIKLHRYKTLISPSEIKTNLLNLAQLTSYDKNLQEKGGNGESEEKIFDETVYTLILEKLKEEDILNYRYMVNFEFKKHDANEKKLYLYDKKNHYEERYQHQLDKFQQYVTNYLSQKNIHKVTEIKIIKNMLQSSVEKIKQVFPEAKVNEIK